MKGAPFMFALKRGPGALASRFLVDLAEFG